MSPDDAYGCPAVANYRAEHETFDSICTEEDEWRAIEAFAWDRLANRAGKANKPFTLRRAGETYSERHLVAATSSHIDADPYFARVSQVVR